MRACPLRGTALPAETGIAPFRNDDRAGPRAYHDTPLEAARVTRRANCTADTKNAATGLQPHDAVRLDSEWIAYTPAPRRCRRRAMRQFSSDMALLSRVMARPTALRADSALGMPSTAASCW